MHIVMLSDTETQGGAAIAASRLAGAFVAAGHRVTRIVNAPDGGAHAWGTARLRPSLPARALRRVLPGGAWEWVRTNLAKRGLRRLLAELQPDVINVHNLHGAGWAGWTVELLRTCTAHAPTAWTLHDMWSFTGRCAYNDGCPKFVTGCDAACPTPDEYPALAPERIAGAWMGRRRTFGDLPRLVAVSPSQWLAREGQRGMWREHRVAVIPYGLSLEQYRPVEREEARRQLGISASGPVLLVAAQDLGDRRKGVHLLLEALGWVRHRPLAILTMGSGQLPIKADGIEVHALGFVADEAQKRLAYSAADALVHPALADNLPLVVMEAIACGTPVVAFPVGGVPDMVRPGETGWLAGSVSAEGLAETLDRALGETMQGGGLRASCRAVAEREYGETMQAQRYTALFETMLDEVRATTRVEP